MRALLTWLVAVATLSLVTLAVAPGEPSTALVTGVVVLAGAVLLASRYLAVLIVAFTLTVGSRARQHEEVLTRIAEPRHPNTAGRPRTRAPARSVAAA
ncbi:DUF6412 domain-containing protein [Microbacteriaceae bacterium 4G12]